MEEGREKCEGNTRLLTGCRTGDAGEGQDPGVQVPEGGWES